MDIECRNRITWLSFILSLFVMMIHVTNFRVYGIYQGILFQIESFIESAAHFAVPTFFAISGYNFYRNYSPEQTLIKLNKRVKTVLVPYFIWGMGYCIALSCLHYIPFVGSFINQRSSFIEKAYIIFISGEGSHFWYLRNLIIYIAIAPLLYYAIRRKLYILIYIACATVLHTIFKEGIYSISMYSVYFFIGGWFAVHFCIRAEKTFLVKESVFAFVVLCLLWIISWKLSGKLLLRYFLYLLGVPMIFISSDILRTLGSPSTIAKNSFFIYVSHVIILETIEKVFWILFPHSVAGAVLDYCIAPVITLCIIYICIKLLSKYSRLWAVITGNRG